MGSGKYFAIREKRLTLLKKLIKQRTESGRDYFLQELANETKIPRGTIDRYLINNLKDCVIIYYDGPLKKIKYIK